MMPGFWTFSQEGIIFRVCEKTPSSLVFRNPYSSVSSKIAVLANIHKGIVSGSSHSVSSEMEAGRRGLFPSVSGLKILRPVLDLNYLNSFMRVPPFTIEIIVLMILF